MNMEEHIHNNKKCTTWHTFSSLLKSLISSSSSESLGLLPDLLLMSINSAVGVRNFTSNLCWNSINCLPIFFSCSAQRAFRAATIISTCANELTPRSEQSKMNEFRCDLLLILENENCLCWAYLVATHILTLWLCSRWITFIHTYKFLASWILSIVGLWLSSTNFHHNLWIRYNESVVANK